MGQKCIRFARLLNKIDCGLGNSLQQSAHFSLTLGVPAVKSQSPATIKIDGSIAFSFGM